MAKFIANPAFRPKLDNAIGAALAATVKELEKTMRDSIESAIYFWPRETQRQNGQTVSSPRDIVDEGSLRDSQIARRIVLRRWEIAWEVAYAVIVLLGFQGVAGNSQPGRDWIRYGLSNIDLGQVFSEELRGMLR